MAQGSGEIQQIDKRYNPSTTYIQDYMTLNNERNSLVFGLRQKSWSQILYDPKIYPHGVRLLQFTTLVAQQSQIIHTCTILSPSLIQRLCLFVFTTLACHLHEKEAQETSLKLVLSLTHVMCAESYVAVVLDTYCRPVVLHYRHAMCAECTLCGESYVTEVLYMHCTPMELCNNVTLHYRHVMCAEVTMCTESYVTEVIYTHCWPMELCNNVTQHYRHVMCAEGTICAESYVAVVLYTYYRPMVLVIMLLGIIGMQCLQRVQCVYMIRCNTVLLSPNIEDMQCYESI